MTRTVINADAMLWLEQHKDVGAIITGLPDSDDEQMPIDQWRSWFSHAVQLCMRAASHEACSIFCQTDRKHDRTTISKALLVLEQARLAGVRLLWHKIVLKRDIGALDLYRPTYSHLMAFSRKMSGGVATPDVMPAGTMIYRNAIGLNAAKFAVQFATSKHSFAIVDPFCGRGTVLAVANALGFDAIGVDIDAEQCAASQTCVVEL